MKRFAKDEVTLSRLTGYIQKGLHYYKSTLKHSCLNVRATHLHGLFIDELKKYEIDRQDVAKLEEELMA